MKAFRFQLFCKVDSITVYHVAVTKDHAAIKYVWVAFDLSVGVQMSMVVVVMLMVVSIIMPQVSIGKQAQRDNDEEGKDE